jgi:hypothetical protein
MRGSSAVQPSFGQMLAVASDDPKIPLNCPVCAAPMTYLETQDRTHIYSCLVHGRFLFPPDDQVRVEPQ